MKPKSKQIAKHIIYIILSIPLFIFSFILFNDERYPAQSTFTSGMVLIIAVGIITFNVYGLKYILKKK